MNKENTDLKNDGSKMNQEQTTSKSNESFITYYIPCLFLLLSTLSLAVIAVLAPTKYQSLVVIMIIAFSIYRWYVSRWVPKVFDRKAAFESAERELERHQAIAKEHGTVHLGAIGGPGILKKVELWFFSKFFSIIAMCIVWLPMEFFIQLKFILQARSAWKEDLLLTSRRGAWPGKESLPQDA